MAETAQKVAVGEGRGGGGFQHLHSQYVEDVIQAYWQVKLGITSSSSIRQFHSHTAAKSENFRRVQTWYTNGWLQQKLPKFGFHTHTTALWRVKQSSILSAKFDNLVPRALRVRSSRRKTCHSSGASHAEGPGDEVAKFDCPVARQNSSLLATAHDCETGLLFSLLWLTTDLVNQIK